MGRTCTNNLKTSGTEKIHSVSESVMDASSWRSSDGFLSKRDCPRIVNLDSFITKVENSKADLVAFLLHQVQLSCSRIWKARPLVFGWRMERGDSSSRMNPFTLLLRKTTRSLSATRMTRM